MRPPTDPQLVYLDPFLVDRLRLNAGLSKKVLAYEATLAVNTVLHFFEGGGLQPKVAQRLATALKKDVTDLLAPWDPRYSPPQPVIGPAGGMPEWETVEYLDQGRLAPNGLYYIVCRLQHRHTAGRFGRGKFFHLSWLPSGTRNGMRHKLSRHADACQRVGAHPHVVINHSSTPVGDDGWWVVDQWIGPQTLQSALDSGGYPKTQLPRLLHELALGLTALHHAGVILRELAPARVLLSANDGRAVLTDFELAKLLEGSPSVSSEWPDDPYRAPELDGGATTIQADLYSFGRIALAVAASLVTPVDRATVAFGSAGIPKRLARYLTDCLHPLPSHRPPELAPLLVELARWAQR